MAKSKKVRRRLGDVVAIPLDDASYGFGRVLAEPLIAFYDLRSGEIPSLDTIVAAPIAFRVCVMNSAVTGGTWPVLGNAPLSEELLVAPKFRKRDPISGKITIYCEGTETPATKEQCAGLECAAVWSLSHIVDRLRAHFAGVPNKWVRSLEFD